MTKKALMLATKSNNVLQAGMYTDVHWSFILLFSQVIFLFKEPYVHFTTLKLFWKRITTESHEFSLECCWKENLQLNNSRILAKNIAKPRTSSNNNFVKY